MLNPIFTRAALVALLVPSAVLCQPIAPEALSYRLPFGIAAGGTGYAPSQTPGQTMQPSEIRVFDPNHGTAGGLTQHIPLFNQLNYLNSGAEVIAFSDGLDTLWADGPERTVTVDFVTESSPPWGTYVWRIIKNFRGDDSYLIDGSYMHLTDAPSDVQIDALAWDESQDWDTLNKYFTLNAQGASQLAQLNVDTTDILMADPSGVLSVAYSFGSTLVPAVGSGPVEIDALMVDPFNSLLGFSTNVAAQLFGPSGLMQIEPSEIVVIAIDPSQAPINDPFKIISEDDDMWGLLPPGATNQTCGARGIDPAINPMTDSLRYFGDVYPLDGLPGALGAAPGPNPEIGENYDHLRIPDVTSGISRRAWVDSNRGLTFEVDAVAQMQAYSVSLFVGDVDHSPWMGKQSGYFGGGYTWSSLSPQALLAFGSTMPGVSYAFGSLGHASGAPVQMNSGYSMSQLGLDELHCAVSYYMPVPGGRRAFVLGNTLTIRTNPSNPFSN